MGRWQKNIVVVEGQQLQAPADLGDLGMLTTGDWLLFDSGGCVATAESNDILADYFAVSPSTSLRGTL